MAGDARWEMDAVLSDGGTVHVRPIEPEDGPALVAFHERLSPETVYRRFFSAHPRLEPAELARFTTVDHVDREALVVMLNDRIIAVGRYERLQGGGDAEVAFVVADEHQGRGMGTLLLEYLAAEAHSHGVRRLVADTLVTNRPMREVFDRAGYGEETDVDGGVVRVTLDVTDPTVATSIIEQREWAAAARSVERILRPRSVAVVGAGRDPAGLGHAVLRNIVAGGFRGPVNPINADAGTVEGLTAYASVSAVPAQVDLAVIAVPAATALAAVDDCAAASVQGLVVISSGFADAGPEGRELERALVERAHLGGMRVVGPNCIGVITPAPEVSLNATFTASRVLAGRIAFASQSGALGVALLDRSAEMGLGLSSFVSMGNKADISGNDLLRYWDRDPQTDVILMYLESFGNPRAFSRIARRVARHKPVIALKGGRTAAGSRAAVSHIAAMAAPDALADALFAQAGVIRVDTVEEVFDTAAVLGGQPLPTGRRVGILGNAGGAMILATDALIRAGLEVPEPSAALQETVRASWAETASAHNPVDLGRGAPVAVLADVLDTLLACGEFDSVLVCVAPLPHISAAEAAAAVERCASPASVPVVNALLGVIERPAIEGAATPRVPLFAYPEPAAVALARATDYAAWRARPDGTVPRLRHVDAAAARHLVDADLADRPGGGRLDAAAADALLRAVGLPTTSPVHVASATAAAAAAERIGLPVALKVGASDAVHRSDTGGVVLGLKTATAVRRAYATMLHRLGPAMGGASVQAMAPAGVETLVGLVHDPEFGPLVMVGLGGITAELLGDRSVHILPLTDIDAEEMIASLRGAPLLNGYRGAPACDTGALVEVLLRVARLAEIIPEVAELDLNPVIVSPRGATIVDAKVRIEPRPSHPELAVRRLRPVG